MRGVIENYIKVCVLMENMKEMTEEEKKDLMIVVLNKKVAFLEGIVDGLIKDGR